MARVNPLTFPTEPVKTSMIPPEEIPYDPAPKQATKSVKVKIEFADEAGTKYSFNIEGTSKEHISKLIDFAQAVSAKQSQDQTQEPMDTNFARVYTLIQDRFRFGSFSSTDVLEAYREEFKVTSSLSVISTYLSRLATRNLLTRSRHGAGWIYRLPKLSQPQVLPTGISP